MLLWRWQLSINLLQHEVGRVALVLTLHLSLFSSCSILSSQRHRYRRQISIGHQSLTNPQIISVVIASQWRRSLFSSSSRSANKIGRVNAPLLSCCYPIPCHQYFCLFFEFHSIFLRHLSLMCSRIPQSLIPSSPLDCWSVCGLQTDRSLQSGHN